MVGITMLRNSKIPHPWYVCFLWVIFPCRKVAFYNWSQAEFTFLHIYTFQRDPPRRLVSVSTKYDFILALNACFLDTIIKVQIYNVNVFIWSLTTFRRNIVGRIIQGIYPHAHQYTKTLMVRQRRRNVEKYVGKEVWIQTHISINTFQNFLVE